MIQIDASALRRSAKRLHRAAECALDGLALQAAERLAEAATPRTPVDTGKLRANWSAVETGARSAEARNSVRYASFVEFDTRHWISRNIVPGQQFMRDAMEETEDAMPDMAAERLHALIERCFGD